MRLFLLIAGLESNLENDKERLIYIGLQYLSLRTYIRRSVNNKAKNIIHIKTQFISPSLSLYDFAQETKEQERM